MEHSDLSERLRQMGRNPVDPDVAARHLGVLANTQPARGSRMARVAVVATAVLLLVAAPAAALVAASQDDDADPVVPAEAPAEGDEPGDLELSCTGPPPFAGEPATPADPSAGDVPSDRAEEAAALEAWRDANCADDDDPDDTDDESDESDEGTTTVPSTPGEDAACNGRPPWAGVPATPADPQSGEVPSERSEEAHDRNDAARECRGETSGDDPDDSDDGGEGNGSGGPPSGVPGGPPDGGPNGPGGGPPSSDPNGSSGAGHGNAGGNGNGGGRPDENGPEDG